MKFIALLILFSSSISLAQSNYDSIDELRAAKSYELVCSTKYFGTDLHVVTTIEGKELISLKLVRLVASRALSTKEFGVRSSVSHLQYSQVSLEVNVVEPGHYWDTELQLRVYDTGSGMEAELMYTDNDSAPINTTLECGAMSGKLAL